MTPFSASPRPVDVPTKGDEPNLSGATVGSLRGAGVEADLRRVGRVAVALCLVALAVVVVVFYVAGSSKNERIDELRAHGVPVTITVTGCLGLLGGSGSNGAGYACNGTYEFGGTRYGEGIPGNVLLEPGTKLAGVVVPGDPHLATTAAALAGEHASWRVFILPTTLLVVLLALGATVLGVRWAHRPPARAGSVAFP